MGVHYTEHERRRNRSIERGSPLSEDLSPSLTGESMCGRHDSRHERPGRVLHRRRWRRVSRAGGYDRRDISFLSMFRPATQRRAAAQEQRQDEHPITLQPDEFSRL